MACSRTYCSLRYFSSFKCWVGYGTSEVTRDPEPLGAAPTEYGAHCKWGTYCSLRNYGAADATLPLTSLFCLISFLRLDYIDTANQRTQWTRPALLVHSRSGRRVQPVDTPMRRVRQEPSTNIPQPSAPPAVIPSNPTAVPGRVVDNPLPPNWATRITPDGKTCEKLLPICRLVSLFPVRRCQSAFLGENVQEAGKIMYGTLR